MNDIILDKPKVKELVKRLLTLDQNMPIRLEDADTCWTIEKIHLEVYNSKLFLSGRYGEMKDEN